ncbi:MAG TPA: ethanolamine utilization protein EutN, partial [Candidatus Marinimicrobia bacterium]|nr:ethanolamine utilization protein EutN [Candidatus Neomarinimicrobiota bacterium]
PIYFTTRQPAGRPLVAVDTVSAGENDTVFYVTSREASLPIDPAFVPVDATIMGVVDEITVNHETTRFH